MTVPKGIGDYDVGYVDRGIASWYGGGFHGRPTASGQIYDQYEMSAAHRLLPLGSVVRVTNAENGRTVQLVINDRGPYIRGRILDLSYAAAERLGAVIPGTLPVVVEVIQWGNRVLSPKARRVAETEENDDAVLMAALPSEQTEVPVEPYRISESRGAYAPVGARAPMDLLRDPRRARRIVEAEQPLDEHPEHAELIEEIVATFA